MESSAGTFQRRPWRRRGLSPGAGAGRLSDALRAAVASEALRKRMDDLGAIPASGEELTPRYVATLIPVEIGRYRALLAGAK